jgi:hypothetical protein
MRYTSEPVIVIAGNGSAVIPYTNGATTNQVQQRWTSRSTLSVKRFVVYCTTAATYEIKMFLVPNGTAVSTRTFVAGAASNNIINVISDNIRIKQDQLYVFSLEANAVVNQAVIYFIGEYTPINNRLLYEGPTMYNQDATPAVGLTYLWVILGNEVYYDDVNNSFIQGFLLAVNATVGAKTGNILVYEDANLTMTIPFSIAGVLREYYVAIPTPFWSKQGVRYSYGVADLNTAGTAQIRPVGYRRQMEGRRVFTYMMTGRQVGNTNLQNGSINYVSSAPQINAIATLLKPIELWSCRTGDNPNTFMGGTIYKNNAQSYYNNTNQGQDLDIQTTYLLEVKTALLNLDINTDTFLRTSNTMSMRLHAAAGNNSDLGYRLMCEEKLNGVGGSIIAI